jgi:hypothetical protein
MAWGIDTSTPVGSISSFTASCIASSTINGNPITFVCRYYCPLNIPNNPCYKVLTRSEAQAISQAGLSIVSVFEWGNTQSYFTYDQGVSDAVTAFSYAANTIGQPGYTPIYFAVDYDAYTQADQTAIESYFQGIAAGYQDYLTQQRVNGLTEVPYYTGVYGSSCVMTWLQTANLAGYFWQVESTGYCGGANKNKWADDNLWQQPGGVVCGVSVDADESWGNGGGWKI